MYDIFSYRIIINYLLNLKKCSFRVIIFQKLAMSIIVPKLKSEIPKILLRYFIKLQKYIEFGQDV
jgi:hypothetical protein